MHRRLFTIAIFCLVFMFIIPASAQTPLPIGQSVTASLTAASPQVNFTLDTSAGDVLQIDLIAIDDGLFLQAVIFDPNGGLTLAIGNTGAENRVRGTLNVTISGRYTLQVSALSGATGTFVVSALGNAEVTEQCELVVVDALRAAAAACDGTARNEACIGDTSVIATGSFAPNFSFQRIGDIVPVTTLETLTLSPYDPATNSLSTVLMRLQANLPDTLPGQNVTLLLFGGGALQDRQRTLQALPGNYAPMQAFYFTPGIGTPTCNAVPTNGLMVRTPDSNVEVNFNINDVEIRLASTVLLTFDTPNTLNVDLLEGTALVTAASQSQILSAGQRVTVPVDGAFIASGAPAPPRPIPPAAPSLPIDIVNKNTPITPPQPQPATPIVALTPTPFATAPVIRAPLPTDQGCVLRSLDPDVNPNIRNGPGTEFEAVSFILGDEIYTASGQNQDGTWYMLDGRGWIAAFVVETAGPCDSLPITYIPPTATPTPTITPFPTMTPTAIMDLVECANERSNININMGGQGEVGRLFNTISHVMGCAGQYEVTYFVQDASMFPDRDLRYSIICTGPGSPYASILFDDGSVRDCSPSPYTFRQRGTARDMASFTILYGSTPPNDTQFDVSIVFSIPPN